MRKKSFSECWPLNLCGCIWPSSLKTPKSGREPTILHVSLLWCYCRTTRPRGAFKAVFWQSIERRRGQWSWRTTKWGLYILRLLLSVCSRASVIVIAALHNRCRHYIFVLWFFCLLLSFFLTYSQPSQIGYLPYFHTWYGLSVNLGLKRAARGSLEMQDPKIRHLRTIAQLCRAISLLLRHVLTIGKNLLNSNISTYSHNMVNFGLLTTEIR